MGLVQGKWGACTDTYGGIVETRGWGTSCSSDDIVAVEQGIGWPIIGRLLHFSHVYAQPNSWFCPLGPGPSPV